MDFGGTFGKLLHHPLLNFGWLHDDGFIVRGRRGQMKLIRRLDVRHLSEHVHQLRQIVKFCKPRSGAIARSFRRKLNSRHGFPEYGSPCVEVRQVPLPQRFILQVALHGEKLDHAVGYRRTRRKNDAMPARQLVHVLTLGEHIAGFLRFARRKPCNIAHFGI